MMVPRSTTSAGSIPVRSLPAEGGGVRSAPVEPSRAQIASRERRFRAVRLGEVRLAQPNALEVRPAQFGTRAIGEGPVAALDLKSANSQPWKVLPVSLQRRKVASKKLHAGEPAVHESRVGVLAHVEPHVAEHALA